MKFIKQHKVLISLILMSALVLGLYYTTLNNGQEIYGSILAMMPPLISIGLALITKEVYSSLFFGILVGGLIYSGFNLELTIVHIFNEGIVKTLTVADNICIIIFLVLLGTIVALLKQSGATDCFGVWALKHIKTRKQAELATALLGISVFVDDNFNCLTVGNVMRPITDKFKISREKLAYIIDSTAAPVCIIAPISSWAAAVAGFVISGDGFNTFLKTIPYNFYALFTIVMVLGVIIMNVDFSSMLDAELLAQHTQEAEIKLNLDPNHKGKIIDLVLPILSLIIFCSFGILYTGGFFNGNGFFESFSQGRAALGLMYGSFLSLIFTIALYSIRNIVPFNKCSECIAEGFKIMVPAILILTLAWSLKAMTDSLGSIIFVENLIGNSLELFAMFIPAFMFIIGAVIAFATGTSWGTFGILIPIVINIFGGVDETTMIISMAACMAGSVCGDHCSPISDTTIMASAGADCNHIKHVTTQFPYVLVVAIISFITYVLTAFITNPLVLILLGSLTVLVVLYLFKLRNQRKLKQD